VGQRGASPQCGHRIALMSHSRQAAGHSVSTGWQQLAPVRHACGRVLLRVRRGRNACACGRMCA
jgi:hypothetical protein